MSSDAGEVDSTRLQAFIDRALSSSRAMQSHTAMLTERHEALVTEFGAQRLGQWVLEQQQERNPGDRASPTGQAETVIFKDELHGPLLDSSTGWSWVRDPVAKPDFCGDGLQLSLVPGGLWGDVFAALPAPPLLLRTLPKDANAIEVELSMRAEGTRHRGEQAGLFWYWDDSNYAKLVVEWTKNGEFSVVFAQEARGVPTVCGKKLPATPDKPTRLRIERTADGKELAGVVHGAYCLRLAGRCDVGAWASDAFDTAVAPRVGISAHGGRVGAALSTAVFSNFNILRIANDRVQWNKSMANRSGLATTAGVGTSNVAALEGWTLSPDISDEAKAEIASLVGMGQANALPTTSGLLPGWVVSSSLSPEKIAEVAAMVGAANLGSKE